MSRIHETLFEIPPSWVWVTLGEIAAIKGGITKDQKREIVNGRMVPYLRVANVQRGFLDLSEVKLIEASEDVINELSLRAGDVLFTEGGDRDKLGRGWVWNDELPECIHQNHIFRARLLDAGISPKLISWFGNSFGQQYFMKEGKQTTNLASVNLTKLKSFPVPVPPKEEQIRLVSKIEELITKLDAGIDTLAKAQALLKRYRASVLKAACEGRLVPTEAELARQEGRDYEPADRLLSRILKERRAAWEAAELEKMARKGTKPKGDAWRKKYKEPAAPKTDDLPDLPEGWVWANLGSIAAIIGGITKDSKRIIERGRTVHYLRVANVQRGYLDLSDLKLIEASEKTISDLSLTIGDVLFTEGGDRDKLGRGWVWHGEIAECIHQNHIFRARIYTSEVLPEIISWYANYIGYQYFIDEGKQTTNLASLNMNKLSKFPVPIPPVAEQIRIKSEIDKCLSLFSALDEQIIGDIDRSGRMRQAILMQAFQGKLVPQDPNDEPASVLLERIKAARDQAKPSRNLARTRRTTRRS